MFQFEVVRTGKKMLTCCGGRCHPGCWQQSGEFAGTRARSATCRLG